MSKHSLISVGLGLGLMAASMGASAQRHTFDYSSIYFGAGGGGQKYVAFVPTLTRSGAANQGAVNVLMMEFFSPSSGTTNSWSFALGGAVDAGAGGVGSAVANSSGLQSQAITANNSAVFTVSRFLGDNGSLSLAFSQNVVVSSIACQVVFNAVLDTVDQLQFPSAAVSAKYVDFSATDDVSLISSNLTTVIESSVWNNVGHANNSTFSTGGYGTGTLSLYGISNTNTVATTFAGSAVNSILGNRAKCVPAYQARGAGLGKTFEDDAIGYVRIF